MNAKVVVGVGNIYANEALFKAGIRPTKQAGQVTKNQYEVLSSKIIEVLNEAITEGGTTLKDYSNAEELQGISRKNQKFMAEESKDALIVKKN